MVYERIFKTFFHSYVLVKYYDFVTQQLFDDLAIVHFSHGMGGSLKYLKNPDPSENITTYL